jgi:hypothetical protein
MKTASFLLAGLLVATVFVVSGNSSATTSFAEEIREPDRTAAPFSNSAASDPGQVVIASGNNRFAVWQDTTPGNSDIFFRRSTDNGVTWQPLVNLSNNPGPSISPQITVVGANVYIVWAQENAAGTTVDAFFIRSLNNGATWGPKVRISTADTDNIFTTRPQVAASGAFVYVTWLDYGTAGSSEAFFRRSINNGGTFQGVVNISNSANVDHLNNIVALAAAGPNVYVAWDDFYGSKDILLKRSTNNGGTFSAVKNLTNGGGVDAIGPDLVATGANLYAAWSDRLNATASYDVFFARSTNSGGTFSAKLNLSNNAGHSGLGFPQIAFSGAFVFVTWEDLTPGNTDILMKRSINNGASFQGVKNLSNNAGSSANPQVATSGANVFFTWHDNTPGNYDIFLRRSTNNGGTLQPLVQISNNAGVSLAPQVTTVGANVYIIWQDNTPGNNDIIDRRSHDNGATWQPTQNLSTNAGQSTMPQIDG